MPLNKDAQEWIEQTLTGKPKKLAPAVEEFISQALQSLPKEDLPANVTPPDWDAAKHFMNAMLFDRGTKGADKTSTRARAQRAQWAGENPGAALAAQLAGESVLPTVASMGLSTGALAATRMAGIPRVGQLLTGNLGGSLAQRAAGQMIPGAWQGALAGSMYGPHGTGENALTGAAMGMGAGPVGSVLGAPFHASVAPEVAQMAQRWQAAGIPLRTSQVPGAPAAARWLGRIGGIAHGDTPELTEALMRTAGSGANRINKETIDEAKTTAMENLVHPAARQIGQYGDSRLLDAINHIQNQAERGLRNSATDLATVRTMLDNTRRDYFNGSLHGESYVADTMKGGDLWNVTHAPGPSQEYAHQLRDALDDAMERNAPHELMAAIRLGRNHYRNALAIEKLADETTGFADPKKVFGAVKSKYKSTAAASEAGALAGSEPDLGVLAEGAQNFIRPGLKSAHPSPATVGLGGLGIGALMESGGLGELGRLALHHPVGTAASMGLGLTYGLGGAMMNNPLYRAYMLNAAQPGTVSNLLSQATPNPLIAAAAQVPDYQTSRAPLRVLVDQYSTPQEYPQ